jgi:hypothetical protein
MTEKCFSAKIRHTQREVLRLLCRGHESEGGLPKLCSLDSLTTRVSLFSTYEAECPIGTGPFRWVRHLMYKTHMNIILCKILGFHGGD